MKNTYVSNVFKTMFIIVIFMLVSNNEALAQQAVHCATMNNLERLKALDPNLESRMQAIEAQTQQLINNQANKAGNSTIATVHSIPVVVHVVYNTSAQNISDAQVQSEIDVLNEDYRRLNADRSNTPSVFAGIAADPELQFCLASTSPSGAPTTGIVRKSTTSTSFSDDDAVKHTSSGGDDAWPAGSYLNLWVCNLGGGLLGYAQFPGGPAATDGVVILYTSFGRTGNVTAPYNKGRTGTHEVGHWLNLRHVWGDANCGDDLVNDTPTQQTSNYGCPSFPHSTCSNGSNGDMFMNYMDYTDDGCMNMFSAGQKARMQALFATGGARASLLTSTGCNGGTGTTPAYCSANGSTTQYEWINNVTLNTINNTTTGSGGYADYTGISTSLARNSSYSISLKPAFSGSSYTEYFKVYIDYNNDKDFADAGENVFTSAGSTSTVSGSFTIPSTATAGTTRMRVMMSDGAISSSCGTFNYGEVEDYSINITAGGTSSCGTPSGLSATSVTSTGATLNWSAVSGASSYNVHYKPTSSTTWTSVSSTTTSKGISGLAASTQYEFQVQAVCSVTGNYSASSLFTTSSSTTTTTSAAVTIGTGTGSTGVTPYGSYYMDERTQFIITQSELTAGGWTSANSYLRSLAFYVTTANSQVLNSFTIKVATTTAGSFASNSFLTGTFSTVFSGNISTVANTWNTYNFSTAFNYTGTGNLLVEICWNNSSYTNNSVVYYTGTSSYQTLYYRADVPSGGVCGNATGTLTYNRPNMKLTFKNSATSTNLGIAKLGEEEGNGNISTETIQPISNMVVFPNPATTNVSVAFVMKESKEITLRIIDLTGRTVQENKFSAIAGDNSANLDVSALEHGNYIIMIDDNSEGLKKRLLIAK